MLSHLSKWLLKLLGWSAHAEFPESKKYIVVAAPHTSNWDFPLGILASQALNMHASWIGKHTIFRWPFGWFFRALGGTPVNRSQKADLIKQIADLFTQTDELAMALAPEGTRSKTDHWKTGFWHIAKAANVPIALAYLDFGKKQVGFGGSFYPGDSIEEDFERIREFYKDRRGKNPANESLIQLVRK
jgi:1-acyl-sn-glycerol-3-phosphate acyltransferase